MLFFLSEHLPVFFLRQIIVLYSKESLFKNVICFGTLYKLQIVGKHLHYFFCLYENANKIIHDDVNSI